MMKPVAQSTYTNPSPSHLPIHSRHATLLRLSALAALIMVSPLSQAQAAQQTLRAKIQTQPAQSVQPAEPLKIAEALPKEISTTENTKKTTLGLQEWQATDYARYDASSFFALPVVNQPLDPRAIDYPLLHAAVFYATNLERKKHGVALFKHGPALEVAAQGHSQAMSQHHFFSHTSVIPGMERMGQRLKKAGVPSGYLAENIAQFSGLNYTAGKSVYTPATNGGYFSYTPKGTPLRPRTYAEVGKTVVQQWMDSPGHRRNILNPNLKYLGAGLSAFEKKSFYNMLYFNATQNFSGSI